MLMQLVPVAQFPSSGMFRVRSLVFFVACYLLLSSWALEEERFNPRCPSFECGVLGRIGFPFANKTNPECGLSLIVDNCSKTLQTIQFGKDGPQLYVPNISPDNTLTLQYDNIFETPRSSCNYLKNITIPISPFISVEEFKQIQFICPPNTTVPKDYSLNCKDTQRSIIYRNSTENDSRIPPPNCSFIEFRMNKTKESVKFLNLYAGWFRLQVNVTKECRDCDRRGGRCQFDDKGKFLCANETTRDRKSKSPVNRGLTLGISIGVLTLLIALFSICIIRRYKKRKYTSASFNSRFNCSDDSSKSELEVGCGYNGIPVFPYSELAKATNNFNDEKELGEGGFGTVYYAKLQDGREVAVKRLYEHNCKRVEQFMNEIHILTRLRHKNLVSLYGCTSRHSQQGLVLVYEYIPNGTVADHLHGARAKPGSLSWSTRIKIAIETASALAYLHNCEIIHRDVKTNNILLDNNFSVKVADFGLSRLFPTEVTHVSTAPQGSPGYVDPEYHQCYQLTDKSDVYSFGVVLIELISSMPAVDMTRHRDEINLANLAINRIQKCAIEELIDPSLGYQSDEEVRRMTTSVAELAFLCLQHRKEMRPPMDVVLEELKRIEIGECKLKILNKEQDDDDGLKSTQQPASPPDSDEASLLKKIRKIRLPSSPVSVTAKWVSSDTTSNVSC